MSSRSDDNRTIAKILSLAFGGKPRVTRYWDDARHRSIDILISEDNPQQGVNSYGTVNLSDVPLIMNGVEYPARLEMVAACGKSFKDFDRAFSTAAFQIVNEGMFCYPGAIFSDVISMYRASLTMEHFLFIPPFLWEEKLQTINLDAKVIAWLLAVPISEKERQFAALHGYDQLVNTFERAQIDIFNLNRTSVI